MWGEVYNPRHHCLHSPPTRLQSMLTQRRFHVGTCAPFSLGTRDMNVLPLRYVQIQLLQVILHDLARLGSVQRTLQISVLEKQRVLRFLVSSAHQLVESASLVDFTHPLSRDLRITLLRQQDPYSSIHAVTHNRFRDILLSRLSSISFRIIHR